MYWACQGGIFGGADEIMLERVSKPIFHAERLGILKTGACTNKLYPFYVQKRVYLILILQVFSKIDFWAVTYNLKYGQI